PEKTEGDINGDGSCTMADNLQLQKYLVCTAEISDLTAADLNADGKVNIFDLMVLKRILMK
ncbi:MAG: dockerin type I repeat-containing protein, partial [Oscillospiraceae bacterium]|nr:dockerin type I repeat-containing protein [Oscillospiraceae bacterium]